MPGSDEPPVIRVLLDQNVPREIGTWLGQSKPGWQISHTSSVALDGEPDSAVYRWAQDHEAVVVTFDGDFADRRGFAVGIHYGIIRLRVWPTTVEETILALQRLFEAVADCEIVGALIIVGRNTIRVRSLRRPS